jgi:CO dehydrogenase nickel-insertion accessory protein CooC1
MPRYIVTAGKGSVGKSTVMAHLAMLLPQRWPGQRLLVVDADPHAAFQRLLGLGDVTTLGALRSTHERELAQGTGLTGSRLEHAEALMTQQALRRGPIFDYLAMGHWALPGSQCAVNQTLERALALS